jgi:CHAD domain-containing protein
MSASRHLWPLQCRAALIEAITDAAAQFPRSGDDEAGRIHGVRRTLKRAAALSRLLLPLVGESAADAIKSLNAARRRVGRARDLDILPAVLSRLNAASATRDILLQVIGEHREAERLAHCEADLRGVGAELSALARAAGAWQAEAVGATPLLRAVRRTYRAARRLGDRALASGEAADLHTLRVRVVDLSHQLAALEAAWPDMFEAIGRELRGLRKTLGDYNDLTVLAEFAAARPELPHEEKDALMALIARRRRPLERRAGQQFARLFAERPGAFERRIAAYLEHPRRKPGGRKAHSPESPDGPSA